MTDYKKDYLKYKFKYLKAKSKKNYHKLKGGNLNSVVGLSIGALFAGIMYYLYTKKNTKAQECINELKSQEELLKEYEKAHLEELDRLALENKDNNKSY